MPGDADPTDAPALGVGPGRSATYIGTFQLAGQVVARLAAFGQIVVVASVFGSGYQADLYFIASIVPLMIGTVTGEALAAALLPALMRRSGRELTELVSAGLWVALALLGGLTLAYVGAIALVVPAERPAGGAIGPWLAFASVGVTLGLSGYLSAVLLRYGRYVWPPFRAAVAAVAGLGLTLVAAAASGKIIWVAWAVATGYALALALMLVEVRHVAGRSWLGHPARRAMRVVTGLRRNALAAATSGVIGGQLFVLLERLLAASVGVGSVASLAYARGAVLSPNVLGQAISAGVYPGMLHSHEAGDRADVTERFVRGLRLTVFLACVFAVYFAAFGTNLTAFLFERGQFDVAAAERVGRLFAAFAPALVGNMLLILAWRVCYAVNFFRATVYAMLVVLAVYVPCALAFREVWGATGLAAAFSVAELAGGLAAVLLAARRVELPLAAVARRALAPALAAASFAGGLLVVYRVLADLADVPLALRGLVFVGGSTALGAAAVGAVLWLAGWPEADRLKARVRRRPR